jgi:hypothetical protein
VAYGTKEATGGLWYEGSKGDGVVPTKEAKAKKADGQLETKEARQRRMFEKILFN